MPDTAPRSARSAVGGRVGSLLDEYERELPKGSLQLYLVETVIEGGT